MTAAPTQMPPCAAQGGVLYWTRSQEDLHGCTTPLSAIRKKVVCMKNNDFIALSAWLFSLLSLLLAVYMLGKGI